MIVILIVELNTGNYFKKYVKGWEALLFLVNQGSRRLVDGSSNKNHATRTLMAGHAKHRV